MALLDGVDRRHPTALRTPSSPQISKANDVKFLIDGEGYFSELDNRIRQARRTIWIVGWDFDPDIRLRPGRSQETLGELLETMVSDNPALEVRILIWGMGPIYSGKSLRLFRQKEFPRHARIKLRFDFRHPVRGCHHQKLVCIDDVTGFIGGIDLTARRWDDSSHQPQNALRAEPRGKSYGPVHDLQAMVSGGAARLIGNVVRRRWKQATGDDRAADAVARTGTVAPSLVPADMAVRLAVTEPGRFGRRGRREGIVLTHQLLRSAKRQIYIETQYLASFGVGRILAERLRQEDGPEIVILVTRSSHGLIEKIMMGSNRDRLIRKLKRADRHDRLRVMYPVVPDGDGECEVLVHSKLIIADDRLLRLGSSNLNNRSEGIDSECDMLIEAISEVQRGEISGLRDRLLAEHMATTPKIVQSTMATLGSLNETIGRLNVGRRCLRHFPVNVASGAVSPVLGTDMVDPSRPFSPLRQLRLQAGLLRTRIASLL